MKVWWKDVFICFSFSGISPPTQLRVSVVTEDSNNRMRNSSICIILLFTRIFFPSKLVGCQPLVQQFCELCRTRFSEYLFLFGCVLISQTRRTLDHAERTRHNRSVHTSLSQRVCLDVSSGGAKGQQQGREAKSDNTTNASTLELQQSVTGPFSQLPF